MTKRAVKFRKVKNSEKEKKISKRILKSEIEIIRPKDKKITESEDGVDEDGLRFNSEFLGDSELSEFILPSGKAPVLDRVSRAPQRQGFRLEKWAEETPATKGEDKEEDNPAKYSIPKIGVTYVEAQQVRVDPTQVDLMKVGREERNFGQQAMFSQSSEAKAINNSTVERYEVAERFDREKIKREENDFTGRKVRYDTKFSGR